MTNKEAITNIKALLQLHKDNYEYIKTLDMAIKALEREPILDQIVDDIKGLNKYYLDTEKVLEIIDKYKE